MHRTAAQLQQFLGHPLGDRRVLRLLTKAPEQRYHDQRRPDAGFMGHDMKHFRYLLTALLLSATAQAGSLEWPQLGGPIATSTPTPKAWPTPGQAPDQRSSGLGAHYQTSCLEISADART